MRTRIAKASTKMIQQVQEASGKAKQLATSPKNKLNIFKPQPDPLGRAAERMVLHGALLATGVGVAVAVAGTAALPVGLSIGSMSSTFLRLGEDMLAGAKARRANRLAKKADSVRQKKTSEVGDSGPSGAKQVKPTDGAGSASQSTFTSAARPSHVPPLSDPEVTR